LSDASCQLSGIFVSRHSNKRVIIKTETTARTTTLKTKTEKVKILH